jgi:dolichol kinase
LQPERLQVTIVPMTQLSTGSVDLVAPTATRRDLQLGRRLVHMANGVAIASAYALLFSHQQLVHVFGTIACVVYIADRVRIHYPEAVPPWLNRLFFRAEEEVKESAMIPYAIAILLTILTFPKPVALIAIYTLAIADPLAAIVGITWGGRELVPDRSIEGMLAFFTATLAVSLAVLGVATSAPYAAISGAAVLIALSVSAFELFPLRIDDNLTIPLFVGFTGWIACVVFGVGLA